jgi:hypothetical protein
MGRGKSRFHGLLALCSTSAAKQTYLPTHLSCQGADEELLQCYSAKGGREESRIRTGLRFFSEGRRWISFLRIEKCRVPDWLRENGDEVPGAMVKSGHM